MNGAEIKKAALNKAKQVAGAAAANGNGQKKRRKGQDLKPIITTEGQKSQDSSPASGSSYVHGLVCLPPEIALLSLVPGIACIAGPYDKARNTLP